MKNTLSDSTAPYRGLNAIVENSAGFKFEVQFHTEQSFDTKQKTHELYELVRKDGISAKEKADINKKMIDLASSIETPKNISTIKSFDNIKKEGN